MMQYLYPLQLIIPMIMYIFSGSGRFSGLYEYEHSEHEYNEYEYEYYPQRGASAKWRSDGCRGQNEH